MNAVGTTIAGFRIAERLHGGAWSIYRAHGAAGVRVIVTIVATRPPEVPALPFAGIAPLVTTTSIDHGFVVIESEPSGWRIGELKWPLPIDEVISVGLDLAHTLARLHAAGVTHGALRPQLTWIDRIGDRSVMSGTTPRPELCGKHLAGESPFASEPFRGRDDVEQLCMLMLRMMTGRANQTTWPAGGDARMRAVEDLATTVRAIEPLVQGLERLSVG